MRGARLGLALVLAAVASVLLAAVLPKTILAGDMIAYRERMALMFSGQVPYFDFPFEHLPGMLVPLALAWLLGGATGLPDYALAFAGLSTLFLLLTLRLLLLIEDRLSTSGFVVRWLLITVPLLPFLLFRNDSFSVLLVVLGIWLVMRNLSAGSLVALVGAVLSKLWPAVWAASEWWRGRRLRAIGLSIAAVVGLAIQFSPAVQSIQDPRGLHTETLMGSLVGLFRSATGSELAVTTTATAYIDAPGWMLLVDLLVGAVLAIGCLRRSREGFNWQGAWVLSGGLVGAGLVASPFFSTQYVAWLGPFVALDRRLTRVMLAINIASLALITTWHQLFEGRIWWWGLLVVRNLTLLALVVGLIRVQSSRGADSGRSIEAQLEG